MKKETSNTDTAGKWYDKFVNKPAGRKSTRHTQKKTAEQIKPAAEKHKTADTAGIRNEPRAEKHHSFSSERSGRSRTVYGPVQMFSARSVPADAQDILKNFDIVVQGVKPLNSRQLAKLPSDIRSLSHELTDERPDRRVGYMNETVRLSAYVRYFEWWNLERLVRLFSNLPAADFLLADNDVCLDIGSGPLTVPIALWLAHPELRTKKLVWYCLDISQTALSFGEELYLAIAAKTLAGKADTEPWEIVRVKGELGTPVHQKAAFITCANVFNELFQRADMPPDYLAKKYSESLLAYSAEKCSILTVEPGVPRSARLLSLIRDALLRKNHTMLAPCPHAAECPMAGRTGNDRSGKWCNFAFDTGDAPARLLKLSADAGIPKERAVLSFIFTANGVSDKKQNPLDISLRIASDLIRLPNHRDGFYACSDLGLVLVIPVSGKHLESGDCITVQRPARPEELPRDAKTGAAEIEI